MSKSLVPTTTASLELRRSGASDPFRPRRLVRKLRWRGLHCRQPG
jgi:hypothetical protein